MESNAVKVLPLTSDAYVAAESKGKLRIINSTDYSILKNYTLIKVMNNNFKTVLSDFSAIGSNGFYASLYYQGVVPLVITSRGTGLFDVTESNYLLESPYQIHSALSISNFFTLVASEDSVYIIDSATSQ